MLTDSLVLEIASANSSQGEDFWMFNESQLSDFASAVIAANNAKALEGLSAWNISGFGYAYSPDQVAPLIQRVKELESRLEDAKIEVSNLINN